MLGALGSTLKGMWPFNRAGVQAAAETALPAGPDFIEEVAGAPVAEAAATALPAGLESAEEAVGAADAEAAATALPAGLKSAEETVAQQAARVSPAKEARQNGELGSLLAKCIQGK